jgi:DNA-binding SARP family transcriptional activator
VHDPDGGDVLLAEAIALSEQFGLTALWSLRHRRVAAELLARAITGGTGPAGAAARLAVACGGDVLGAVAVAVRASNARALVDLAQAASEAPGIEPRFVRQLLRDADPAVRTAGRRARRRLESQPRAQLRIVTLGRLAVFRGETRVPEEAFGRQAARRLLAILLSTEGPVHRDALLEWLWPHLPPDRGRVSLNSTLYSLRRAVDPGLSSVEASVIATDGETYALKLQPSDEWDAARFEQLADRGLRASSPQARIEALRAAEACYAGRFLPEWPYDDWAAARRGGLEQTYGAVLQGLAEAFSAVGEPELCVARYERLLEVDPEREAWHRALMQAYARAGERPRALRQYHACRTLLRERLAVEPSQETRALYRALL